MSFVFQYLPALRNAQEVCSFLTFLHKIIYNRCLQTSFHRPLSLLFKFCVVIVGWINWHWYESRLSVREGSVVLQMYPSILCEHVNLLSDNRSFGSNHLFTVCCMIGNRLLCAGSENCFTFNLYLHCWFNLCSKQSMLFFISLHV